MRIDGEGHIIISPQELQNIAALEPAALIERYLIPGTPICFGTRDAYYDFLDYVSHELGIHHRNIVLKGSTKTGFSIAPKAKKLWMSYGSGSDLDLAVVDSALYDRLDNEVRHWERENGAIMKAEIERKKLYDRRNQRKNYCCRYFDMPAVKTRLWMFDAFTRDEATMCSGFYREVDAFIYKDWWSLRARFEYDLKCLSREVNGKGEKLSEPPTIPLPYVSASGL